MMSVAENSKPPSAMSRSDHPPEEILSDILLRLPVKSIGKSRCVSKHWNSLLTSPRFIKAHLARSHQKNLLMLSTHGDLITFKLICPDRVAEGNFENRHSIPTPFYYSKLVGYCNGLVVIGTVDNIRSITCEFLMNPITYEHSSLPEPPCLSSDFSHVRPGNEYGLGYDSSSDDYKFVQLFVVRNRNTTEFNQIIADIYSFKNKCWRRVNIDHRPFWSWLGNGRDGPGVFFNGALHWLCSDPEDAIIAFDLTSEKCYEIPPLVRNHELKYMHRLTTLNKGSCLGIVCREDIVDDKARIEIWTMKEYGIAESWTKNVLFVVVDGSADKIGRMLWFWSNTLVIPYPYKLTFYSFNDEKSFNMALETRSFFDDDDDDGFIPIEKALTDGLIFTESLVSPLSL